MTHPQPPKFSVVVPCYNETEAILTTIAALKQYLADRRPYELIVVDDGSNDGTRELLQTAADQELRVFYHSYNRGYGAALKTGIRNAVAELIVITDADGTYPIPAIPKLLEMANDADMVVGARITDDVVYPVIRKIPKLFLRSYASWLAGCNIPDINSGLRVFRRSIALRFIKILPDGFSFTTTITLAMLINHYQVRYLPIGYRIRVGTSKIRPFRDTLNFMQLIVRTGVYFAPIRVFMPIAVTLFISFAISLGYDIFWLDDITDKTLLFLFSAMNTAMFALLADMIDKRSS